MPKTIRVLIIDDESVKARSIARLARCAARRLGVHLELVGVSTLRDALVYLQVGSPVDGVVSDWHFPVSPGEPTVEAGRQVVTLCQQLDLPVVVVSGAPLRPARLDGLLWAGLDWLRAVHELLERAVAYAERARTLRPSESHLADVVATAASLGGVSETTLLAASAALRAEPS